MTNQQIEDEKIQTLNVNGKQGVNILKRRYDHMTDTIMSNMPESETITLNELSNRVEVELRDKFDGKVGWYFMAVKLDLEARGVIERVAKIAPQTLIRKQNKD